jgi:Domain of unknown function (DUF4349)
MHRPLTLALLATTFLAGCGDDSSKSTGQATSMEAAAPVVVEGSSERFAGGRLDKAPSNAPTAQTGEAYTYDHDMTLSMAGEHIKARFERARDACLNDPALKCRVVTASFRILGEPDAPLPVANLSVALPHDSVPLFEKALLVPLPGENSGDLVVQSRSTNAQNVTNQVRDIEGRLSQLANYRDRMTELTKRPKSTTDDLIRIEGEISRTQSEIEMLEGQRRDLAERIAKENLSIAFIAQSTAGDALQPVAEVWQSSLRLLAQSAAGALALVIGLLPWIPVFVLGFFLFRFLWRLLRRKQA